MDTIGRSYMLITSRSYRVKTALKPGDPSHRSLSKFLKHQVSRSVASPFRWVVVHFSMYTVQIHHNSNVIGTAISLLVFDHDNLAHACTMCIYICVCI